MRVKIAFWVEYQFEDMLLIENSCVRSAISVYIVHNHEKICYKKDDKYAKDIAQEGFFAIALSKWVKSGNKSFDRVSIITVTSSSK